MLSGRRHVCFSGCTSPAHFTSTTTGATRARFWTRPDNPRRHLAGSSAKVFSLVMQWLCSGSADVIWWWIHPCTYLSRSRWLSSAVHLYILFIAFNGADRL